MKPEVRMLHHDNKISDGERFKDKFNSEWKCLVIPGLATNGKMSFPYIGLAKHGELVKAV